MTNLAEVIPLFSACDPRGTAACGCTLDRTCYSHRIADAADRLRVLPDEVEGDAWVARGDLRRAVEAVLYELDAVTAETLPDERTVR